jgi:MerR family transcriptional regulator, light-induced transcriptional regulator
VTRFDRLRTEPVYNTMAVVQRTGVPADTFRAWERRYGLPLPCRTAGNQRLYSERDIAVIAWLRDQTRGGVTISQAVALYRTEPADRERDGVSGSERDGAGNGRWPTTADGAGLAEFRRRMVEALVGFDGGAADRVVEEAIALVSVEDVCLHVLQSALIDIGNRWQGTGLCVSAEHFASCFVMRKFAALFNLSQPQNGRGPIVAACVEGEHHEIGLLLTSLFLSRHGYQILYFGADLPLPDLLATVREVRPPLVLLSATMECTAARMVETVTALRSSINGVGLATEPPQIGYGGRIFVEQPALQRRIDGVFLGRDARETVDAVDRMLAPVAA